MRTAITWTSIGLSATLACTSSAPDPNASDPTLAAEPSGPPIGAWVVVDDQLGLFASASKDRPITTKPGPHLRVAEVVGIAGDFIEVRTITSRPGQRRSACASRSGFVEADELRFFVEASALQRVLARPKRVEFDDQTMLELAPGVLVIETGKPGQVEVGGATLFVDLREWEVARWYLPPAGPADHLPWTWRNSDLELHYGANSFEAGLDAFWATEQARPSADGQLLTFSGACGRFVLRAELDPSDVGRNTYKGPEGAIPQMPRNFDPDVAARSAGILAIMQQQGDQFPLGDDSDVSGGFGNCRPLTWTAAAGTTLHWAQGGDAGVTLYEHELADAAEESGGQVCFPVSGLEVCIETRKLARAGESGCGDLFGLGDVRGSIMPGTPLAQVRPLEAEISEGLDHDIVRRIVRAHLPELRRCYATGLERQPTLHGRVEIGFTIASTGKVATSEVVSTTLEPADETLRKCFAEAGKRWTFPKPRAGANVTVVYPFVLSPG